MFCCMWTLCFKICYRDFKNVVLSTSNKKLEHDLDASGPFTSMNN